LSVWCPSCAITWREEAAEVAIRRNRGGEPKALRSRRAYAAEVQQGRESGLTGGRAEEFGKVGGIPSGGLSAQLDAPFVLGGSDKIDGEVSDDRHVFGSVTFA
jgi:hypothetical protein